MRRSIPASVRPPATALVAAILISAALPRGAAGQVRAGAAVPAGSVRWSAWARGVLLFGGLVSMDSGVRDGTRDLHSGIGNDVATFGRWYGDWRRSAPLVGGTLLAGALVGGSDAARRGAAAAVGVLAGSLANEAVNVAVGRDRPSEEEGPLGFEPFEGHASFPSGHAAYAFAIAGAIDEATDGPLPAILGYAAAALVGVSRVYDDRHWLSDVAIGALVGMWTARRATAGALGALGVDREDGGASGSPPGGVAAWLGHVEPVATRGFVGIRITR